MNVLIIGGTKFIGPATAKYFHKAGHHVTLFHRKKSSIPDEYMQIQGDCNVSADIKRAIELAKPDVIVHMIALYQSHIEALEQALEKRQMRAVIISSADVYRGYGVLTGLESGPIEPIPFTEQSALREVLFPYRGKLETDFAYDYEKILVEKAALQSTVLDSVILRLGMVYGENDSNRRFSDVIRQMGSGADAIEISSGMAEFRSSKCYVEDVAHGIVLAAEKSPAGEIYNLSHHDTFTELEWSRQIAKLMNWHGEIHINPDSITTGFSSGLNLEQPLVLDTAKIRTKLGYDEVISFEEGLMRTIHWEQNALKREDVG